MATAAKIRELCAELLAAQIRKETIAADHAQLELDVKVDKERDRLVGNGKLRVINFFGPVIGDLVEDAWEALEHWRRRDPKGAVEIVFNSPGGDIINGLALYDKIQHLRREGHHVTTRATGMAASMGAVLLQAGDERVMDARAKMLIHAGSTAVVGSMSEVEDHLKLSNMLREDLWDILSERATISRRTLIQRAKRKDWWFGAEEALKLGLVDRVE